MRLAGPGDVAPSTVSALALACCLLLAGNAGARTPDALQCQSKVWKAVADVASSCRGYGIARFCSSGALGRARSRTLRILAKRQAVAPPDACIPHLCVAGETPYACADKLVTGTGAPEPDALDGWQPSDFQCLRKSARLLGRVAKAVRKCERAGAQADACLGEVVTSSLAKLEQQVATFVGAGASLHRCVVGGCRSNADVSPCVRAVVEGDDGPAPPDDPPGDDPPPVDPGDVTREEAECRSVSAVVLEEFDARVAKCRADADDLASCLLQAREKREEKVILLLRDDSVRPEVCFPGVCTPGQTPEACAFTVFELHAPGSGKAPPDPTRACRQGARTILDALAADVAACHATHQAETAAGRAFDLDACVQAAVGTHRPSLVAHLDAQLADGIPPDQCLPVLCAESGLSTAACADAAIADTLESS